MGSRALSAARAAAAAIPDDRSEYDSECGSRYSASLAGTSVAGCAAAEERIAAAAAAAAGAVVASECIKWRARSERLEAERKHQLAKRAELHESLRKAEAEYHEAQAELSSEAPLFLFFLSSFFPKVFRG